MAVSERHLPEIKEMIDSTTAGLNANIPPEPTKGVAGGSYFMPDASGKPLDEELSAGNNPEQQQSEGSFVEDTPEGLKKGTQAGKGSFRETGAYPLDHPISGRRPDPPTAFGSWFRRKVFSFIFYNSRIVSERLVTSSRVLLNILVDSTIAGLDAGIDPDPTPQGAGGSYFMRGTLGNNAGVFKPRDEEPNAVIMPQQQQSKEGNKGTPVGLKKGTKAGKGCFREVAAYLLDHPISGRRPDSDDPCGFAGVPPTTFGCTHDVPFKNPPGDVTTKEGSLQMYMENDGDCSKENIGPDGYNKFRKDEVHKIAVLDIRLANADRHGGNILRMRFNYNSLPIKLIPIDHGYCFPDSFGGAKFVWLTWPQAKEQFSDKTIEYIQTLDAQKDIDFLKESFGWDMPLPIARVFRVSTMLLKKGARKCLTPHAIGKIMCRSRNNEECKIEKIFNKASEMFVSKEDDDKFIEVVSGEIDSHLDKIAKRLPSDISLKIGTPS